MPSSYSFNSRATDLIHSCMAVVVVSAARNSTSATSHTAKSILSILRNMTSSSRLEQERIAAQEIKVLAERYGGRAIERSSSAESTGSTGSNSSSCETSGMSTSPSSSSFQPFSSKWTARYWQLQKTRAERTLEELARREERANDQVLDMVIERQQQQRPE